MKEVVQADVKRAAWPHQQFKGTREKEIKRRQKEEGGKGVRE